MNLNPMHILYELFLYVFEIAFKSYISDSDIKSRVIHTIQLHQHFITLKSNKIYFQKNNSILINNVDTSQLSGIYLLIYY